MMVSVRKMTNVFGELMAILRLIQSCHDMAGVMADRKR